MYELEKLPKWWSEPSSKSYSIVQEWKELQYEKGIIQYDKVDTSQYNDSTLVK